MESIRNITYQETFLYIFYFIDFCVWKFDIFFYLNRNPYNQQYIKDYSYQLKWFKIYQQIFKVFDHFFFFYFKFEKKKNERKFFQRQRECCSRFKFHFGRKNESQQDWFDTIWESNDESSFNQLLAIHQIFEFKR